MKNLFIVLAFFLFSNSLSAQTTKATIASLIEGIKFEEMEGNNIELNWKSIAGSERWQFQTRTFEAKTFEISLKDEGLVMKDQYKSVFVLYANIKVLEVAEKWFLIKLTE